MFLIIIWEKLFQCVLKILTQTQTELSTGNMMERNNFPCIYSKQVFTQTILHSAALSCWIILKQVILVTCGQFYEHSP